MTQKLIVLCLVLIIAACGKNVRSIEDVSDRILQGLVVQVEDKEKSLASHLKVHYPGMPVRVEKIDYDNVVYLVTFANGERLALNEQVLINDDYLNYTYYGSIKMGGINVNDGSQWHDDLTLTIRFRKSTRN